MTGLPFHTYREYKRVYSYFHITENGIYKEDEVPADYEGGADLKVEVVHEIYFSDKTGRFYHCFYDIPDAMDQEDKLGGGYTNGDAATGEGDYVDHEWYPNQGDGGDSTVRTKLYTRTTTRLSVDNTSKSEFMDSKYQEQQVAEAEAE